MLRQSAHVIVTLGLIAGLAAAMWSGVAENSAAQEMGLEIVVHADDTATVGIYGSGQTETVHVSDLAAAALRASGGKTGIRVILRSDEPFTPESAYDVMTELNSVGFHIALVAEDKG